jgi:hypothetical protein
MQRHPFISGFHRAAFVLPLFAKTLLFVRVVLRHVMVGNGSEDTTLRRAYDTHGAERERCDRGSRCGDPDPAEQEARSADRDEDDCPDPRKFVRRGRVPCPNCRNVRDRRSHESSTCR